MRLIAENLAVRRGDDLLFEEVSFSLARGEALVVTGRNGTGKSTLLRTVAGLIHPESGHVLLTGIETEAQARPSEASHYLGHRNAMKQELTVRENLLFWKRWLGDFRQHPSLTVEEAAEAVGLGSISHLPFGYLSAGQQRRFAMAKLLVAHRPIWVLDEPTAALDTSADRLFVGLVEAHLDEGGLVLAATHQPLGLRDAKALEMRGFAHAEADLTGMSA